MGGAAVPGPQITKTGSAGFFIRTIRGAHHLGQRYALLKTVPAVFYSHHPW